RTPRSRRCRRARVRVRSPPRPPVVQRPSGGAALRRAARDPVGSCALFRPARILRTANAGQGCDAAKRLSTRRRRFGSPPALLDCGSPRRGDSIVSTRISRICVALAAALALAVLTSGCGGKKKEAGPEGPNVPALRFAGV